MSQTSSARPTTKPTPAHPTPAQRRILRELTRPGARIRPGTTGPLYRITDANGWQGPRATYSTVHALILAGWIIQRTDGYGRTEYVLTRSGRMEVQP